MTCEASRRELLDAEPERLRRALDGSAADELARHIGGCAHCRAAAEAILAAQTELTDTLIALTAGARGPRLPRRQRRIWPYTVPLALAASLAAITLLRPTDKTVPPEPVVAAEPPPVVVNVTGDRNVTIFKAADPTITVIWYY